MDFFQTSPALYDPAAYAAFRHQTAAHGNSAGSPPESPRGSSSFSAHALRDALPSLPRHASDHHHEAPMAMAMAPAWGVPATMYASAASHAAPSSTVTPHMAHAWLNVSSSLRYDTDDQRITQAVQDLFFVFAHSPTFRQTMQAVQAGGPVSIRVDPEVATGYCDTLQRAVVLGDIYMRSRSHAVAILAFELTNASLAGAFAAHYEAAARTRMTPSEFAEGMERVEYNTIRACQASYLEARAALQEEGIDNPNPWNCRVTPDGRAQPAITSEDDALHSTQASGHFGRYEQGYAGMLARMR
ncbi:hypothetical protein L0935_16490 [Paracidovorax citrulli]|uniref:Uncharacterized protein n=2 Tax=Paracidovorax citrulli TaxID=80869 RepID=A1TP45_PARC0|nr:hypothetical protein [Paracidovorax citrulli]ABM32733.1 hypothetical protein Aave_2155 [Paracidovorax citrulli AAC00-1]ATG93272.1 hypothetical protein CQB05_03790 [Paracidovorax citrulli]WIY40280.1 hypothetical protein QRO10_04850 [Paracidovorax citrulli]WIY42484.1 hypothetical protein QRO12_16170 [Paracidovorax citrulli]